MRLLIERVVCDVCGLKMRPDMFHRRSRVAWDKYHVTLSWDVAEDAEHADDEVVMRDYDFCSVTCLVKWEMARADQRATRDRERGAGPGV